MAVGGAGIVAGVGALLLFLRGRGAQNGKPAQCPTNWVLDTKTGECTPVTGAGTTGVDNTARDVNLAASIAGGVLTVAGKVISSVAGGGAAVAGGKATASAGVSAGSAAALAATGAGWGGVFILAVIVAVIVATQIVNSVQIFQNSLLNFFREQTTVAARQWFKWFVGAALTAGKPPSLGYVPAYGPYKLNLPSDVIRKAVLTALYLDYVGQQATYTALEGFWSRSTGQVPQPGMPVPIGGSVQSGQPWSGPPGEMFTTAHIKNVLGGPGIFQCAPDANPSCNYAAIVAPASFGEAYSAALSLLGEHWQASTALQEFNGKLRAIAFATTQLFKEHMPSPYDFVTAVRDTVVPGWEVREAAFWTSKKEMLHAYWLVDPVTGNRVAPDAIRSRMAMVVSMKGMAVSPGVFAGAPRGFAGRRFARFGDAAGGVAQNECWDAAKQAIVACNSTVYVSEESRAKAQAEASAWMAAIKSRKMQPTASAGGGAGGLLPWAAGALLLAKVLIR